MSNALCKIIRGKNNSHENNLIKIKKNKNSRSGLILLINTSFPKNSLKLVYF